MRLAPPKKQEGHKTGPRRLDGALKDVASIAAKYYGGSEKKVRAEVARGVLPHRRLGGRIIFLDEEVTDFFRRLPGVTVSEALANRAVRRSSDTNFMMKEDAAQA